MSWQAHGRNMNSAWPDKTNQIDLPPFLGMVQANGWTLDPSGSET